VETRTSEAGRLEDPNGLAGAELARPNHGLAVLPALQAVVEKSLDVR